MEGPFFYQDPAQPLQEEDDDTKAEKPQSIHSHLSLRHPPLSMESLLDKPPTLITILTSIRFSLKLTSFVTFYLQILG